ncbi:MAG: aminotransferase class I/II-fold pyridoxal phosphate-dependent enzyme [Betaproteobacteria bacterium]|nr:aminotransferase class I/II-fold pyridoxal phosphate-dependent enzyme [Betaproteobacteria bacterium]
MVTDFPIEAHANVRAIASSLIREVANAGLGKRDVLPFWFGEPDEVTPQFIRDAATEALARGETFYTHNYGLPALREALAAYVSRLRRPVVADEIVVTSSGMSALMLVSQALVGRGDRVVAVTPLWPNITSAPRLMGAQIVRVPLEFRLAADGNPQWSLDLERLLAALTPDTRALYLNAPNNPTGWMIDRAGQKIVLEHCRRHGIWIVADDAYERLYYPDAADDGVRRVCAPSFLDLAERDERVLATNTFSKSWLMTGWRLGWLVAPRVLVPEIAKLIEFNTSSAPGFIQYAGLAAIANGEPVIARTLARFRRARDFLVDRLRTIEGVQAASPPGAMYAFFRVDGMSDSLAFCKRMVVEAGLGLAPGAAFGEEGEGFVRWCFAADEQRLADGIERLRHGLRIVRGTL